MKTHSDSFCGRTRREFLWQSGNGFTGVALASLLAKDGFLGQQAVAADGHTPYATGPQSHFPAKAKSVIFLYMYGGPSQVDTFDHKPKMKGLDGKTVKVKTKGRGGEKNEGRIVEPRWDFKQYGQSGAPVSDLFPHLGTCVDDILFLKSMTADSPLHGSAMLQMNTGSILSGDPSLGSWVNYGLGSMNRDLPGFVVMLDPRGGPISGAKNWSSGYMPANYQATMLRSKGTPILNLDRPRHISASHQRRVLDLIREYNLEHEAAHAHNSALAARIESYELAYRMQSSAPEATNLASESQETRELYGLHKKETAAFGRQCLLARRLVERGTRFVQLYSGGNHIQTTWDAHEDLVKNHGSRARETDQPIAALIKDLKRRGMLEETLIVWGGEFGRQPTAEYAEGTGRDHNSYGFTMWMAGGGVKSGHSIGQTDELGSAAVESPFHVRDLHATILQLMGMDPNHLTYFYGGLDRKLVGPAGANPIPGAIA